MSFKITINRGAQLLIIDAYVNARPFPHHFCALKSFHSIQIQVNVFLTQFCYLFEKYLGFMDMWKNFDIKIGWQFYKQLNIVM